MPSLFAVLILGLVSVVLGLVPPGQHQTQQSPPPSQQAALDSSSRRHVLATVAGSLVGAAALVEQAQAQAASTYFFDDETVRVASQMPTGGKVDLNSAFVGDYKQFPGMFPHAAGQIASHGPYQSVKDIYKIPTITANDKMLFQKYDKEFTVNAPGRAFGERINGRVST